MSLFSNKTTVVMRPPWRVAALCCLLGLILSGVLLLGGCGKQEDGSTDFGGGIGGTGTGAIDQIHLVGMPVNRNAQGLGNSTPQEPEIVMGETRRFTITPETEVLLNGEPLTLEGLDGGGAGWVASVFVGKDANTTFTRGTALSIHIRHRLIGPVTREPPELEVLGQPVFETNVSRNSDSAMSNMGHPAPAFAKGSLVLVSGFPDRDNHVQATLVEDGANYTGPWLLSGPVSAVEPGRKFKVGDQEVGLTGVRVEACGEGIQDGDWVTVKAEPVPDFNPSQPLDTATVVQCAREGLEFPQGAPDEPIAAELEGLVHHVTPAGFVLGGQWVSLSAETVYAEGRAKDIVDGQLLRVSGVFVPLTDTLHALKVRVMKTD